MPTPTYIPLATTTLASSASSVTFSSISGSYRDLVLVCNYEVTGSASFRLFYNSDTTTANYPVVAMRGDGSSATSFTTTANITPPLSSSNRIAMVIAIQDYSATDKHKSYLVRFNDETKVEARAARWANTSAITTVEASLSANNFTAGSTFSLFGIEA